MKPFTAQMLFDECNKTGVKIERIELDSGLLTLTKTFPAGDKQAYISAETDTSIIYGVPYVKGQGSTWGTTGDGIGGYSAVLHGKMVINRSACKKTFLKELSKLIAEQETFAKIFVDTLLANDSFPTFPTDTTKG